MASLINLANSMNIRVVAKGVETMAELETLQGCGLRFVQGYFFAKPRLETPPCVDVALLQTAIAA